MKKRRWFLVFILITMLFSLAEVGAGEPTLSITGVVRQPLNLGLEDIAGCQTVRVQLNEVMKDGTFKGVFYYRGVPLRTLLDMALIEKEETAFSKKTDLAVVVRSRDGKEVALSWGEIFYRNSGDIIVATSASPIMPHKNCASCHDADFYKPYMDQLSRDIVFPKLVVAGDAYADRSIEDIVSIEVIDPRPRKLADNSEELFSPEFVITGDVRKETNIADLLIYPRVEARVKHLGEGKGFHGISDFSGASLKTILDQAGIDPVLSMVFFVSAPDGYYSLFSYGEIYLNRVEESIIVADRANGEPIEEGGKFFLIPTEDLMSDRDVKSLEKIEVITLKKKPRLFIIGIGSGDTNLITMEAVSAMAEADVFICPDDIKDRFTKYMGNKPILMDIYEYVPPVMKKKYPDLSQEEVNKLVNDKRAEIAAMIEKEIDEGRNVALLDYGDPTIWSGSEYIREYLEDKRIEIIPGLSSFNAGNALLKYHVGCNGSIILTTPRGIMNNRSLFESAAKNGETLCVFMGLTSIPDLMEFFNTCYDEKAPVSLVYLAGYSGSERVVETNLENLQQEADKESEKNLGLIYIGPCLDTNKAFEH
ncbi:SAM-dependent methyltransferase [Deltaproteobacteria bacterium]|nr:SAM-dependent methyltransferase [Deltaproteobacteria bacterium]